MSDEQLMVERAAETVAQIVAKDAAMLTDSDPLRLVMPHISELEHGHLVHVSLILLQRFRDTASGRVPELEPLVSVSDSLVAPVLSRLEQCMAARPAFQSANSLTPLLTRAVVLAAQCCSLVVRDVTSAAAAVHPLCSAFTALGEVITSAVLERVEQFRPLDSSVIFRAHQTFVADQAKIRLAFSGRSGTTSDGQTDGASILAGGAALRALAPQRAPAVHQWRNTEIKQFWESKCRSKYGYSVPVDVLAVLLLRGAGLEVELGHREAIMKRLSALSSQNPGHATEKELDGISPEVRRCGGIRAWVGAVLLGIGSVPTRLPSARGDTGEGKLSSTWGGTATGAPRSFSSGTGARTMPLSARGDRKSFALTSSLGRRANFEGSSLLHNSVERNLLKTTQHLVLGSKVGVDARSCIFNETPLHSAAVQDGKHAPLASLLLANGADVNAADKHLSTPLHIAASTGHGEVARKLLKGGADVKKADRWSTTPLHRAAHNGQKEMVEILLKHGASTDAVDDWGSTPLHNAAARGQLSVAEHLIASGCADVHAEDCRGEQPLHLAARLGDYAMVKLLLESGASPAARSGVAGSTPEDCARQRGHSHVLTLFEHRDEWVTVQSRAVVAAA
mmetsp:Transcript_95339/g.308892  ORF Transcript_95339/g.308892 Transcript_95339/m.308892 type:complete len:621 (-) Transcript_95339:93-1955(-)|eukprot:CAMPEP_0203868960 /NCGR_PEP_ID=MMETSP0359-20131031/17427_1 /ASSEMBLY_ACC=CAM_ASM_000338 /TAXON_ID=268821 /ORGANISM="Scrippsiella Hangoei, Strain SHTV-5" /LENGTH=620 /DNA_ID=CAMNT_0050787491 /DNA_START=59 /DNA_END=1921 /DNA_ORIENTATION=+